MNRSYFFGARCAPGSTQLDCGLWTDDCTRHLYWSIPPNQGMAQAHQQVVSVGSAVVFNDKIYAFAPLVGDPTPGDLPNWYAYTIKSYILELKLGGKSVFNRRISCDFYKMDLIYGAPLRPLR